MKFYLKYIYIYSKNYSDRVLFARLCITRQRQNYTKYRTNQYIICSGRSIATQH